MRHQTRHWMGAFAVGLSLITAASQAAAQRGGGGADEPEVASALPAPRFEYVGPTTAGRFAAAAAIAGQPGVYYAGAASGGVWKSTDGGATWKPTFDDQPSQAIGALAVAPSNPNVVWAGTGEAWAVRDMDMMGDGIYKSTDAGETWTHMGLAETGRIGTIIVHPTNENIVMVCALGRASGPQRERGVFRTEDGGRTWSHTLFVNEDTGCSGLQLSQQNPDVVIAGTWELLLLTHVLESGGMGSGVYISHDGGRSFEEIEAEGLPRSPYGKTDVAIAPSDGNRMYALIQTGSDGVKGMTSEAQGSLWRSDNAGRTWRVVSWDRRLIGRAGYYIRVRVAPDDPDHVLVANSTLWRSHDGGRTFGNAGGGCGDCHDIWWDTNADMAGHYIVTGDNSMGIFGSPRNPDGVTNVSLPIGQMYRATIDQRHPYWIYSDRQDNGSMRFSSARPIVPGNVPSYEPAPDPNAAGRGGRGGRGGGRGAPAGPPQESMPSCESGYTYPEPNNHRFVWGTCYAAHVATYDEISGTRRSVSPWQHTLDSDPVGLKYRCQWSPPLAIDWFDNSVYFGCQVMFRTRNRGQSWEVISGDLSTGNPDLIRFSGGVTGDNLGQFYGAVISAIAPSRTQQGVVWVGTNDGKVWISRNAGGDWEDLTDNIDMPPLGIVRRIDASHSEPGTAYMAVDYHLMDNRDPYLFRTSDFGKTWTRISDGLPSGHPLDYTLSIAENPHRKGMLYAGTGHGFFYSLDDGATWTQFKDKLPAAPVNWIEVPLNAPEVVVATYGRGVWVLRDVWQIEQADIVQQAGVQLYKPRQATRTASEAQLTVVFELPSASTVTLEVTDAAGEPVTSVEVQGRAGRNEYTLDLLYPEPDQPVLRSLPPDNAYIWEAARWEGRERPVTHWGLGAARWRTRVAPGEYTLRLAATGQRLTQPFKVVRDPVLSSTTEDLVAGTEMQLRVVEAINEVVDKINRIEIMRAQVEDLRSEHGSDRTLDRDLQTISQLMYETELHFLSRTEMHSDDKWYVEKYRLYMNLVWLLAELGGGGGDVAGGVAYRPTNAAVSVFQDRLAELDAARTDFDRLLAEVAEFNRTHSGRLPAISDRRPIM
jgi:hypothetical protein